MHHLLSALYHHTAVPWWPMWKGTPCAAASEVMSGHLWALGELQNDAESRLLRLATHIVSKPAGILAWPCMSLNMVPPFRLCMTVPLGHYNDEKSLKVVIKFHVWGQFFALHLEHVWSTLSVIPIPPQHSKFGSLSLRSFGYSLEA